MASLCLLLPLALYREWACLRLGALLLIPLAVSFLFAVTVWRLRAATPGAAALGGLICLLIAQQRDARTLTGTFGPAGVSPGLAALLTLFLLTFAGTRFRRHAKERAGLAESRQGRHASQIAANLGIAGLCAAAGFYPGVLAALAEATADTISSELGQAIGGKTLLLTTLRPVPAGTDGGMSLLGTLAGIVAAGLVVVSGLCFPPRPGIASAGAAIFLAGALGLLADSLLGATVERRGWIGNDLVNLSATLVSALLAAPLLHLFHAFER